MRSDTIPKNRKTTKKKCKNFGNDLDLHVSCVQNLTAFSIEICLVRVLSHNTHICYNSNNQSHKTMDNVSYTFVASSVFVLQIQKTENSVKNRFFIFTCWG